MMTTFPNVTIYEDFNSALKCQTCLSKLVNVLVLFNFEAAILYCKENSSLNYNNHLYGCTTPEYTYMSGINDVDVGICVPYCLFCPVLFYVNYYPVYKNYEILMRIIKKV